MGYFFGPSTVTERLHGISGMTAHGVVVTGLLSVHLLLVAWLDWAKCLSTTEIGHIGAAVYTWETLRFDVYRVNPPLTRFVFGLPMLLYHPTCDWRAYSSSRQARCEAGLGAAALAQIGRGGARLCFASARWSLMPLLLLGGYFGYRLSRDIYGEAAAVAFLALWCFSPLLVAWGATVCPDSSAAALGIVAIYTFRQWLLRPGWARAGIAGVSLGLLPLTKLTWIVALGLWPLIWCLWAAPVSPKATGTCSRSRPPFRQMAAILLLAIYTINLGYLFEGSFRPLGRYVFASRLLAGDAASERLQTLEGVNRFSRTSLGALPVPFPAELVQGMDMQRRDFEQGMTSYLRGRWSDHGWWYYYLYALLVKEPLGTWCLVTIAAGATIFGKGFSAAWRDEMIVLLPFVTLMIFVSSQTGFSLHCRYILPALPFLYVWISKAARVFDARPFTRKRMVVAAMAVLALAWSVSSSLAIYPHSLSYFNELAVLLPTPADASCAEAAEESDAFSAIISAGPRNGPRHLLGSNIDCGQDLFCLEDWCESHPDVGAIKVAYSGGYPLDESKIKSAGPPPIYAEGRLVGRNTDRTAVGPLPGWYALSVDAIYDRSRQYRYFLRFRPFASAGYSVYIYHITASDANRVRRELGLPELPRS